jgi:hypothetical protein
MMTHYNRLSLIESYNEVCLDYKAFLVKTLTEPTEKKCLK